MEGFKFSPEALEYEQKKSEKLLREARGEGRKMETGEIHEFLGDMDEYARELKKVVEEQKAKLAKAKSKKEKKDLKSEIEELEAQIAGFEDFQEASQEAEEFTVKDVK